MKNRFAKKVDRSQSGIVKALRKIGAQVIVTNYGQDFPDLLCGYGGHWKLLEVKEPDGDVSRGQLEFIRDSTGYVQIVTNDNEAINAMFPGCEGFNRYEKNKITEWLIRNPNQETIRVQKLLTMIGRLEKKSGSRGSEKRKSTYSPPVIENCS